MNPLADLRPLVPTNSFVFENASQAVSWCRSSVCDVALKASTKEQVLWAAVGALFCIILLQWLKGRMLRKSFDTLRGMYDK